MKRFMLLFVFVGTGLIGTGCSMSQINEDLAQDCVDTAEITQEDMTRMHGWLEQSMNGDNSWNEDEQGNPIWEAERDSMKLNAKANVDAAKELLENAKSNNK